MRMRQWIMRAGVLAAVIAWGWRPAQASSITTGQWTLSPTPPVNRSDLFGVSALSSSDAWTVGSFTGPDRLFKTLAEHFNGSSWSVVPSPNVGTASTYFNAVAAVSSSDIWAVGGATTYTSTPPTATDQPMIEHYNGSSWSLVSVPAIAATQGGLLAISASSASDIWAVGWSGSSYGLASHTLVMHYDGAAWSVVPSPNMANPANTLAGIVAISATNAWAVGSSNNPSFVYQTLIEHWDGTSWSIVSSPNPRTGSNALFSISAVSATDIWAVGGGNDVYESLQRDVILHYNGSTWSSVAAPLVFSNLPSDWLTGVVALSASDAWAVGTTQYPSSDATLALHWNGTTWSIVPSPSTGESEFDDLQSLAGAGGTLFAAGRIFSNFDGSVRSLVMRWQPGTDGPAATIGTVGTDANGHKFLNIDLKDGSGVLAVAGTKALGCSLAVTQTNGSPFGPRNVTPSGTVGTIVNLPAPYPTSVRVTVTQAVAGKGCSARVSGTNASYATTFVDPLLTTVVTRAGIPMVETEQIDQSEHWVTIDNLTPGLSQITLVVNGRAILVQGLHDGEQRTLDIGAALSPGLNTVQVVYLGQVGSSAAILFSE
jgi:hypothetical protein